MTRVRRRSRAVYRVYGEEEYLAGADTSVAQEDLSLAAEPASGRGLRRIACATALTGTVGAVGGVVGLAGPRTHARALDRREIAQRIAPSARATPPGRRPSEFRRVARGQSPHRDLSRRVHERRLLVAGDYLGKASRARTSVRALTASTSQVTPARRSEIDEISDRQGGAGADSSDEASSAAVRAPVESPSAAPQAPPETEARPAAQSEFGFER
jgi:hypothetical protein